MLNLNMVELDVDLAGAVQWSQWKTKKHLLEQGPFSRTNIRTQNFRVRFRCFGGVIQFRYSLVTEYIILSCDKEGVGSIN